MLCHFIAVPFRHQYSTFPGCNLSSAPHPIRLKRKSTKENARRNWHWDGLVHGHVRFCFLGGEGRPEYAGPRFVHAASCCRAVSRPSSQHQLPLPGGGSFCADGPRMCTCSSYYLHTRPTPTASAGEPLRDGSVLHCQSCAFPSGSKSEISSICGRSPGCTDLDGRL
jgi:hypothetical protein